MSAPISSRGTLPRGFVRALEGGDREQRVYGFALLHLALSGALPAEGESVSAAEWQHGLLLEAERLARRVEAALQDYEVFDVPSPLR
jgi:hypothetical protein